MNNDLVATSFAFWSFYKSAGKLSILKHIIYSGRNHRIYRLSNDAPSHRICLFGSLKNPISSEPCSLEKMTHGWGKEFGCCSAFARKSDTKHKLVNQTTSCRHVANTEITRTRPKIMKSLYPSRIRQNSSMGKPAVSYSLINYVKKSNK